MAEITMIPVAKIKAHPDNPRKDIGDVTELAENIKVNGILQNLTVVPILGNITYSPTGEYTVVIGHRRLAAAKLAGIEEVPCVIADMSEIQQIRTMLTENMQRTDLTVYEQAQGFQMMLDMGDTVDQIAERAGFSKTTVRRRIKMAELDQGILQRVSERQLSLSDFDKLAQIDDLESRNRLLEEIGTGNFDNQLQRAFRKQEITKKLPAIKAQIKKLKANKIEYSAMYNAKYDRVGEVEITKWTDGEPLIESEEKRKLFYYLDESWGKVTFFCERPKAKPVKRSQAEIDKEKRIEAAWNMLKEQSAISYKLRHDFINSLSLTTKNTAAILKGAACVVALRTVAYVYANADMVYEVLGVTKGTTYDAEWDKKVMSTFENVSDAVYPRIIYAAFSDGEDERYSSNYQKEFPEHKDNLKLNVLYSWLISLGYEMSDDEKAMKDGTHELFAASKEAGE